MPSATLLLVALAAIAQTQAAEPALLQRSNTALVQIIPPVTQIAGEDSMTTQLDLKRATSTLPLPPIVAPPVLTLAAQNQVVMGIHHKRQPQLTTDLFIETLKNLPKPGPMPTTSVHYDAAWTSSVSSQISAAVKKARTMTSKTPQQKLEDQKKSLIASVTSAEAGLKSASIASSSASSVESAEASAKARESRALKNSQHNLNDWFYEHNKHSAISQASPVIELSGWITVAIGFMLTLSVL